MGIHTAIARDIDELDTEAALELVNELNIHADVYDSTVNRTMEVQQSSRFVLVGSPHTDEERELKWYRRDGSVVLVDYVMIDEHENPRVSPGQPYTTLEDGHTRKCDECGEVSRTWTHDEDRRAYLCIPCAEEEYGVPVQEWYEDLPEDDHE